MSLRYHSQRILLGTLLSISVALVPVQAAFACTWAVYLGPEDTIITVRSMDWKTDLSSNLWAFPRGMQRDGAAGSNSIRWTSKYGSVVASVFEAGTADGMNEKGLVATCFISRSRNIRCLRLGTSVCHCRFPCGLSTFSTTSTRFIMGGSIK